MVFLCEPKGSRGRALNRKEQCLANPRSAGGRCQKNLAVLVQESKACRLHSLGAKLRAPIVSLAMRRFERSTSNSSPSAKLLDVCICRATRYTRFLSQSPFQSEASAPIKEASLILTSPTFSTVGRMAVGMARNSLKKSESSATLVQMLCFASSFRAYVSTIKRRLSPARASWLYVSQKNTLDEKHQKLVEQIRAAHDDLDRAYALTQEFVSMLAEHRDKDLDDWLAQAKHSGIKELKSFANGIQRDYAAVRASFTSKWSNGPVEAQVNCLKLQKRLMFGRANFDLLRLHVLRRA